MHWTLGDAKRSRALAGRCSPEAHSPDLHQALRMRTVGDRFLVTLVVE